MKRFAAACFCLTLLAQPAAASDLTGGQMALFMGFIFKAPLQAVQSTLGQSPVSKGSGICYKAIGGYMQFLSVDGKYVSGFAMSKDAPDSNCTQIMAQPDRLHIGPLYLGMSRRDYNDVFKKMQFAGDPYLNRIKANPQFENDILTGVQIMDAQ